MHCRKPITRPNCVAPVLVFLAIVLSFVPHDRIHGLQAALIAECLMPRATGHFVGDDMDQQVSRHSGWSWWYLLLLIQFIAVLWPPFYNKAEPALIGMPFFYWYQLLWIIIGAILTAIVHFATDD